MTLTEFLLARIEDDDAITLAVHLDGQLDGELLRGRWAVEREAKRALIEEMAEWSGTESLRLSRDRVLRHLALPYWEHPDWREEWRP